MEIRNYLLDLRLHNFDDRSQLTQTLANRARASKFKKFCLLELFINVESSIVSLLPNTQDEKGIKCTSKKSRLIAKIDNKIQGFLTRKVNRQMGSFSYPVLGTDISTVEEIKNADIIYIHWALNGFLNFSSVEKIARLNKPTIVFLHDMWNITGGCHHSFTCDKYKTEGCNSCPMFSTTKKK